MTRFTARIENTYTRRLHAPGSAGLPSLAFVDDVEAGLFMDGATLGVASDGRAVLHIDSTGAEFLGPIVVDGQLVSGNISVTVDPADLSNVASHVVPAQDDAFTFGTADRRWHKISVANVFAVNVTTDTIAISDALLDRVANALLAENLVVDLQHIESDIAPAETDRYDVGGAASAWSELFLARAVQGEVAIDVNDAIWSPAGLDANTIAVSGNLLAADGGVDRFIDLEHIDANVAPDTDGTRAIGAPGARWASLATDVIDAAGSLDVGPLALQPGLATLTGTLVTDGNVVDHNGASLFDSFDPGNVETTIAPASSGTVGAVDRQWRAIYSNAIDLGNVVIAADANGLVVDSNIFALTAVIDGCPVATPNVGVDIASITVVDESWAPTTDPLTSVDGGFVVLTGEGLGPELAVFIGDDLIKVTTYVSDTECRLVVPPMPAGTYDISVYRVDTALSTLPGAVTIVPGIVLLTPATVLETEAKITLGKAFEYIIDATLDGVGRVVGELPGLSFETLEAPAGFSISPNDGVISGSTFENLDNAHFAFRVTSADGATVTSNTSFTFVPNGFDLEWIRANGSVSWTTYSDDRRCFMLPLLDGRWVAWGRFDRMEYGTKKLSLVDPTASDSVNLKNHGGKIVDIGSIGSVKTSIDAGASIVDAVTVDGWQSKQATARILTTDGRLHVGGYNYHSGTYGPFGMLGIDSDSLSYSFFRSNVGSIADAHVSTTGYPTKILNSIVATDDGRLHVIQLPTVPGKTYNYKIGLDTQSTAETHWEWRELVLPDNQHGTSNFSKPRIIAIGTVSFILLEDGRLFATGNNLYGRTGRFLEQYNGPWRDLALIDSLGDLAGKTDRISAIRVSSYNTMFTTTDNELYICGITVNGTPAGAPYQNGETRIDSYNIYGLSYEAVASNAHRITRVATPIEPHEISHFRVMSRSVIAFAHSGNHWTTGLPGWRNNEGSSTSTAWRPLRLSELPALEGEVIDDVIGCESVQMIMTKSGKTYFRSDQKANGTGCMPYPLSQALVDEDRNELDAVELTKEMLLKNIYLDP